jgi:hypothetical protein
MVSQMKTKRSFPPVTFVSNGMRVVGILMKVIFEFRC